MDKNNSMYKIYADLENLIGNESMLGELIFVINSDTTYTYELYKIIEKNSKKIGINILNSESVSNTAYKC